MGEFADMVLEGLLCEQCGGYIDGAESGYPRLCAGCKLTVNEEAQDLNVVASEFNGKVSMVISDDELALSVYNDEDKLLFVFKTVGKTVVEVTAYE